MDTFEALREMVDTGADVDAVRRAILDAMQALLAQEETAMDDWRMAHLINAVGAFSLNCNAVQQPTTAWLRLCVDDLEKATRPADHRADAFGAGRSLHEFLATADWLRTSLEALRRSVETKALVRPEGKLGRVSAI